MDWLIDFLDRGGPVLYAILFVSILLWTFILDRLWFFYHEMPRQIEQARNDWVSRSDKKSWQAHKIRVLRISRFSLQSQQWLAFIAVLIAVCPLMGLLGTVTGMIGVFDVLAVTGTGNPRAMASGISKATLPTMAGLLVALAGLYFKARFQRLSQRGKQALADALVIES